MTSCIEWLYRMVVQWLYRSGGRKGLMLLQLRGAPGASPVGVTLGGLGLGHCRGREYTPWRYLGWPADDAFALASCDTTVVPDQLEITVRIDVEIYG